MYIVTVLKFNAYSPTISRTFRISLGLLKGLRKSSQPCLFLHPFSQSAGLNPIHVKISKGKGKLFSNFLADQFLSEECFPIKVELFVI